MSKHVFSLSSFFTAVAAFLVPLTVKAVNLQSEFADTQTYLTDPTGAEEAGAVVMLMFMLFLCVAIIVSGALMVIWVLALVDMIQRDNWKSENDKIIWILLLVFVNVFNVVSIYYYFFYRKQLDREVQSKPAVPTAG